jgi:hypothetical protein
LTRPSASLLQNGKQGVDHRDKPGDDDELRSSTLRLILGASF